MSHCCAGNAYSGDDRTNEVLDQEASFEKAYSRPHAAVKRTSAALVARDQFVMDTDGTPRGLMAKSVMERIISGL